MSAPKPGNTYYFSYGGDGSSIDGVLTADAFTFCSGATVPTVNGVTDNLGCSVFAPNPAGPRRSS